MPKTLDLPFPLGCGAMVPHIVVTRKDKGDFEIIPFTHGSNKACVRYRGFTGEMEIRIYMSYRKYNEQMRYFDSDEDDDDFFVAEPTNESNNERATSLPPTASTTPTSLTNSATASNSDCATKSYEGMSRKELTVEYKKREKKNPPQHLKKRDLIEFLKKDDQSKLRVAAVSRNAANALVTIELSDDDHGDDDSLLQGPTKTNAEHDKENKEPANPDGIDLIGNDSDSEIDKENEEPENPDEIDLIGNDDSDKKEKEEPANPDGNDLISNDSDNEGNDPNAEEEPVAEPDLDSLTIAGLNEFYEKQFKVKFPSYPKRKKAEMLAFIKEKLADAKK